MKAIVIHEFGGPEVLSYEDVPDPVAGPGEIVVQVHAVSINRVLDVEVRKGNQMQRGVKLPYIPGIDPSGVVAEAGEGVKSPKVGDRVMVMHRIFCGTCDACKRGDSYNCQSRKMVGIHRDGGDAEYIKVPATAVQAIPENLSFAEATIVARHCPTAYNLLVHKANLQADEWVLIMGAAGNLGSIGIQMAKMLGAKVITTAGSDQRVQTGLDLGADHAINYNKADLRDEIMRITDGHGVDLVYDNIANPETTPKAFMALAFGGRLVTAGAHGGPVVPINFFHLYDYRLTIIGSAGARGEDLGHCLEAVNDGKIKVLVDRIMPLSETAEAHRLMELQGTGKVILDPTLDA